MPLDTLLFAPAASIGPTLAAALLGLLIGSFLNVVIHRVPLMMQRETENFIAEEKGEPLPHTARYNLMWPGSSCPACATPIKAHDNIPVLGWLLLGGKCRACKAPISVRYPVVELISAALAALIVWKMGSSAAGMAAVVLAWFLVALTFIDLDTQFLPDDLTYPLLWLGLLLNLSATFVPLRDAVIGAAAGYLVLWAVYWLHKLATGKEGMGYGDFKLLAALGAWMGWMMLPIIILLSSVVAAVVGLTLIALRRQGFDKPIPFGPYLAGAGLLALLWGEALSQWIAVMVAP